MPGSNSAGSTVGAPWRVHARRAAGQDQRRRLAGDDLRRPACRRGRSRSRPAPPAPGGRSAGRTARRSRRRGRWAAAPVQRKRRSHRSPPPARDRGEKHITVAHPATASWSDRSAADGQPHALELLEVRVARLRHRPAQGAEQVDRAVRAARPGRTALSRSELARREAGRPPSAAATGAPPPTSSRGRAPGASAAPASCSPSITASAPQAIALATSPELAMPPSAITWT